MSNQNVIKASEIIIEYMYRNEEKSFMDVMKDGDNKLTTLYRLQHHIFHSVLMLKFNGDETKFNEWFDEFCDDNGICEIYDDEVEDDYLETKCGCQIIINSREHDECRCDQEGENWICADCYDGEYDESEDEETEVEKYEYDDNGVKVVWNKETEGWDCLEPYCRECGKPESDVEVDRFTIENEVFICKACIKMEHDEWNNKHPYTDRDLSISGDCIKCEAKCETIDDTLCHYCYHHSLKNIEDCWCCEWDKC